MILFVDVLKPEPAKPILLSIKQIAAASSGKK